MPTIQKEKDGASLRRCLGIFMISNTFISEWPEMAMRIMGECIIVRAEADWARDQIQYTAISRHFDPIEEGSKIPVYMSILGQCEDGPVSLRFFKTSDWRKRL